MRCSAHSTKHSDFLPSLPRRFVSFARRYRRCALGFAPAAARRYDCGPGVVHRNPHTGSSTETTGAPRFLENPTMNVPCSSTPAGPQRSATATLSVLSSAKWTTSTPTIPKNFGAQSHGPFTRCLRFAGWVTPPPRKTRFRVAGHPCPGGSGYPLGSTERFQIYPSSFPRLSLAHPLNSQNDILK
jgi:hypothetical protein